MKIGALVSIIGAVSAMSLLSLNTAHAAPMAKASVDTAQHFDAPVSKSIPLPEPAAWTMFIIGVGVVGFSLRRRVPTQSAAREASAVAVNANFEAERELARFQRNGRAWRRYYANANIRRADSVSQANTAGVIPAALHA